jgi:predicted DNA-binding transcriptional regulator AlpA
MSPDTDILLRKDEVAAFVRVTPRTLNKYWSEGKGPRRTRVGRRVLVSSADLAAWIAAHSENNDPSH